MKKTSWAIAAILLLGAPVTGAMAQPDGEPRSVLIVLAHPDDELVFAPAIAAETRAGSQVRLLYATSGDAGPGVSDFSKGNALAQAREAEATCAADALGAETVDFLRLGDGTLTSRPRADGSPAKKLLGILKNEIVDRAPDIVVTWGPDGGYGHGDHRMVSALVTQSIQQRTEGSRPDLLFPAMIHTPLPDVLQAQGWTTTAPDLALVRKPYSDADLAAAAAATQCHKTQFDDATRSALVPGFHAAVWKGEVAFRSAF
ncbi:PIG-L family deacetylase [Erythrobacter ani]|uniref:PIG-L family deacetylase n=1 Tax=Erythrobacter ani TaxID=2827235 RepID=A0ABS6SJY7_9SPHN|nr:PIG-L family deacetylase [Erythrobacter ani]MBV7265305.1 PIG-L family deacetylase [Erythrobacter ani]